MTKNSVRVALRIRPQSNKEKFNNNEICIFPDPRQSLVSIGKHTFSFDYTFGFTSTQEEIFEKIGIPLVDGCLEGYNATIFAYGQTGSGKTFSMGTAAEAASNETDSGLVPRCLKNLFEKIEKIKLESSNSEFQVHCYFLELYNEELRDLLCPNTKEKIQIHQGALGNIYFTGQTTRHIENYESAIDCLKDGSIYRTTACTNMNSVSSRSHSVFTLDIRQFRFKAEEIEENSNDTNKENKQPNAVQCGQDKEVLYAKFNFVDLAGSERLKRTGATGEQAKEGININRGLLALGNVISVLGDAAKSGAHVPYRDSKLTRLLQDSLGGNSRTVMLACVSPSDCDFLETLNTLRYATRARTITNKVVINQDKNSRLIASYKEEIGRLKVELEAFKSGQLKVDSDGQLENSDVFKECVMLRDEINKITQENKSKALTIQNLTSRNATLLADVETYIWLESMMKSKAESTSSSSEEVKTPLTLDQESLDQAADFKQVISRYAEEIENLRTQLWECETTNEIIQTHYDNKINLFKSKELHLAQAMEFHENTSPKRMLYELEEEPENISFTKMPGKKRKRNRKAKLSANVTFAVGNEGDDAMNVNETVILDQESSHCLSGSEISPEHDGDDDNLSNNSSQFTSGDEETTDDDDEDDEDDEEASSRRIVNKQTQDRLLTVNANIDAKVAILTDLQSKHAQLEREKIKLARTCETLAAKKKEAEEERDMIMSNLGNLEQTNKEKFKKMKDDLDTKIKGLKEQENELKKAKQVQEARIKELKQRNEEIKKLKNELTSLRNSKQHLTRQLREETKKAEQLKVRSQQQSVEIKRLKTLKEKEMKAIKASHDMDIRRKNEEIVKLRRLQSKIANSTSLSDTKVNAPRSFYASTTRSFNYSKINSAMQKSEESSRLHSKYNSIMKSLDDGVKRHMTIAVLEKDLSNWLNERDSLKKRIDQEGTNSTRVHSFREQLKFVQESVKETQEAILELNKVQDGFSLVQHPKGDLNKTISICQSSYTSISFEDIANPTNLRYLLYRLYDRLFENGIQLQDSIKKNSILDTEITSLKNEIEEMSSSGIHQQYLPRSSSTETIDIKNPSSNLHSNTCQCGCRDFSAYDVDIESEGDREMQIEALKIAENEDNKELFNSTLQDMAEQIYNPVVHKPQRLTFQIEPEKLSHVDTSRYKRDKVSFDQDENQMLNQNIDKNVFNRLVARKSQGPLKGKMRSINSVDSLTTMMPPNPIAYESSNNNRTSTITTSLSLDTMTAADLRFPEDGNQMKISMNNPNTNNNNDLSNDLKYLSATPSTSGDVKNDSLNTTTTLTTTTSKMTCIDEANSKNPSKKLNLIFIADGHSRSVLDVDVHNQTMVTGSKDRSTKIWDLTKMQEVSTIKDFPSNVRRVRINPFAQMIIITCSHYINLRDLRDPNKSIKTILSSGGQCSDIAGMERQDILPAGETLITDMTTCGSVLYSDFIYFAAANSVRVLDIRNYECVSRLTSSGQTPVMALAVSNKSYLDYCKPIHIATGSKDHNVRVYSVDDCPQNVIQPKHTLEPPHYDGIETLAMHNYDLLSGGRDMVIKKWNLEKKTFNNISNAHKDWILSLAVSENRQYMFSACRSGTIKMWDFDSCNLVQEISPAHSDRINKIFCNDSNLLFSASEDKKVKIWSHA